jgi:hypothetical protein
MRGRKICWSQLLSLNRMHENFSSVSRDRLWLSRCSRHNGIPQYLTMITITSFSHHTRLYEEHGFYCSTTRLQHRRSQLPKEPSTIGWPEVPWYATPSEYTKNEKREKVVISQWSRDLYSQAIRRYGPTETRPWNENLHSCVLRICSELCLP